jgi:hypothetical protein
MAAIVFKGPPAVPTSRALCAAPARSSMPVAPSRLVASFAFAAGLTACSADVRRFPLRDPIWKDADLAPVSIACRPDQDSAGKLRCAPASSEASSLQSAASRLEASLFVAEPGREALNVNSVDEVPDSAWFTNRIGAQALTPEDIARGPCGDGALALAPDPDAPDGAWVIDRGNLPGEAPSFRVDVAGLGKFVLSIDSAQQPERATGAAATATRLYHAAGYWVACESVVHVRPAIFKLMPGLTLTDERGVTRAFDAAALEQLLRPLPSRGGLARLLASRAFPGRSLGPFSYEGTRHDDPRDAVAHEDRRDLRGARVLAAWLDHARASDASTRDVWLAQREGEPLSSPGVVRHYQVGLGDCFGRQDEDEGDDASRRLGSVYQLDLTRETTDLSPWVGLERPFARASRPAGGEIFGDFSARDLEPRRWQGGYPNLAFARMSELDGAWAARRLARFTPELVEAAVRAGDYTLARHTAFLTEQILLRREALLRRYLARVSPITDVYLSGEDLCGKDLGRSTGVLADKAFAYRARAYAGADLAPHSSPAARPGEGGSVCLTVPHVADDSGPPDDSASRYVVVDIFNGVAPGPLRAHLYDLGPRRGFRLVGLERPDDDSPPG